MIRRQTMFVPKHGSTILAPPETEPLAYTARYVLDWLGRELHPIRSKLIGARCRQGFTATAEDDADAIIGQATVWLVCHPQGEVRFLWGWLNSVTASALKRLARSWKHVPLPPGVEKVVGQDKEKREAIEDLREQIQKLDPDTRAICTYRYLEEHTVAETRQKFGLSEMQVKRRTAGIRKWLFEALGGKDIDFGKNRK